MSEATKADLEAAIRAHIASEYDEPRVLTDWVMLSANQGLDDSVTGYAYSCSLMSAHVLTGLIGHFLHKFKHEHVTGSEAE